MIDTAFGTLLVPSDARALERDLHDIRGWRVATFAPTDAGFAIAFDGDTEFVDFAAAPFPCIDAAAILFTDATAAHAHALAVASGLAMRKRLVRPPLADADRAWLDDLAVSRFADMLAELTDSHAAAAALRIRIDEVRTNFSLLETYLHRHDVPPLRRIWHAPYRDGTSLDATVPFEAALPCASWGLTRLQLWVVAAPSEASLRVELATADSHEVVECWSISPDQIDHRSGWISCDLERSHANYGQPLRIAVSGRGWRLGGSAPWLISDGKNEDEIETVAGPAMRVYATLPGIRGPRGATVPVDDRRILRLLKKELAPARALAVPDDINFSPVGQTDQGLLVHPVPGDTMIAAIDGACPALTVIARLSVLHNHSEGVPFLVTLTPGTDVGAETDAALPRATEDGVLAEIGPVAAGTWVRVEPGARARVAFTMSPSPRTRALHIATRPAEGRRSDLAWATVTGVEFVLADG